MKITIEVKTDNAAFDEDRDTEVGRILREALYKIESGHEYCALYDVNGNRVGSMEVND